MPKKGGVPENLILWEKGKSGNPKGRPKKSFGDINDTLKAEGYTPLEKHQLLEAYALVFNCDEEKLKQIGTDPKLPYAFRLIVLELNKPRTRMKALQDYRDYCFGKAKSEGDEAITELVITVKEHLMS